MAISIQDGAHEMVKFITAKNHTDNDMNYTDFRANHTVHGVCTLYSLGASKERIEEYYNIYKKRLEPLRTPKFKIDDSNWEKNKMDRTAYAELLPYFEEQVKTFGVEKCFEKFIPRLLPGFVSIIFHPLIQIGFGVEYNFPEVVAEGLAYACTYYNKIGEIINQLPPDDGKPSVDPLDLFKEIHSMALKPPQHRSPKFPVDGMLDYHTDVLIRLTSKWKLNDVKSNQDILDKLAELTRAIIIVTFGSHRRRALDFFLIHSVTSLHSIRVLLPKLSLQDQKRILQISLVGFFGNMWLQGMPDIDPNKIMTYGGPIDTISWDSIIKEAIACNDEHVPKIIRCLLVIRDEIPDSVISHEMIQRSALMTTDFIKTLDHWELQGIGFPIPT